MRFWRMFVQSDHTDRSKKRQKHVDNAVATLLEHDADEMLEQAEASGSEKKRKEAEARMKMAEEIRNGGEMTLLLAMGVLRDDGKDG